MKRTVSLLLAALLMLSLAACSPAPADTPADAVTPAPVAEPSPEPSLEPTPKPTPEPTPEPTPLPMRTRYVIEEDALSAPVPDENYYGVISLDEPEKTLDVIDRARELGLLKEDETVIFDPAVEFYRGADREEIEYYLDETILVICWKEVVDGCCCSYAEVKIADPSQFRRKLAGDAFDPPQRALSTEMHAETNAVLSLNADLNSRGEFLFTELGQNFTREEMEQYIADNDIVFSLAFGPVLIRDGEAQTCDWYPVGEATQIYSRAGIGWVDDLHYLYMSLNHCPEKAGSWTVTQFASHFAEKDAVRWAYCLDGGQTGEMVFRGRPYNHIDFGWERTVSDNIYFATAIGGTEILEPVE